MQASRRGFEIVIIGGGASGTLLAAQLMRHASGPLTIHLIERRREFGRGVAYSTSHRSHLLNVPCGKMSALPDEPDHFVNWLSAKLGKPVDPTRFASRPTFGDYLEFVFADAQHRAPKHVTLRCWSDEAIAVEVRGGRAHVVLQRGVELSADRVILAVGHFPPGHPTISDRSFYSNPRYLGDPWSGETLPSIRAADRVLLVGSGLTAVDLALALAESGNQSKIVMLSHHGRLPEVHRGVKPLPWPVTEKPLPTTTRALTRLVRRALRRARDEGYDWRAVIDALRPLTQDAWRGLDERERRRFLRHVRPFWERHRHRMAREVADAVSRLLDSEKLVIIAGHVRAFRERGEEVEVLLHHRGGGDETMIVDKVVNCTGPECDYRRVNNALTSSLFSQGLARMDALGLGLDVSDAGALLDAEGRPNPSIFAIGPLRKADLWETTAIPEIRVQAEEMAKRLCDEAVGRPSVVSAM